MEVIPAVKVGGAFPPELAKAKVWAESPDPAAAPPCASVKVSDVGVSVTITLDVTVSVIGIMNVEPRLFELIKTVPLYNPGANEPGRICTVRFCGVVPKVFPAIPSHVPGTLEVLALKSTGVFGSVLVRGIGTVKDAPPCCTEATPKPDGRLTTS